MPKEVIYWSWEEAFDKFGFDDGDGPNFTDSVVAVLWEVGCTDVVSETWGIHNYMIHSLAYEGKVYGSESVDYEWGYDDPRCYLPASLVSALDAEFSD